jgi:chemotaxis protein CheX
MQDSYDTETITELVSQVSTRTSMDAKFLSAFLQSAVEVITTEVGGTVERGQVTLERSSYATNDVNVILTVVGRLRGVVIYGMPQTTALGIVSQIIGQPVEELDELAQSGIAELGNVITGRASTILSSIGYPTNLSVPTLVVGKAMISVLDFHRVVVPLNCRVGSLEVHLALREEPDGSTEHIQ